ncbi:MAG: DUF4469 domain-containing protein [Anaerolineae bacterium]|nr:DUF4469 domain-containing protein [Anaerolineae bacterium]
MTINYALHENNLTSDPGDYTALVQPAGTAELEDVIERIIAQGSTVTRPDIVSVLEDYHTAIEALVLEGVNVNTPSANYRASIKGVFAGLSDGFDPSRHQVHAAVSAGRRFRRAVQSRAQVVKGEAVLPRPNPVEFTDVNTGERNSVLTPGGMAQVLGHRLKFDSADAAQGIYFVDAGGGETKVGVVGQNKPGSLMFVVPQGLASGNYTLEVRASVYSEDVRAGALDAVLTVL